MSTTKETVPSSDKPQDEDNNTLEICPGTLPRRDSSTPSALFISSGSSQEDVNQYAHTYVSQIESGQERSCAQVVTFASDVILAPGPLSQTVQQFPWSTDQPVSLASNSGFASDEVLIVTPSSPTAVQRIHNLFPDSDSDVLSLGDYAKLQSPKHLFADSDTGTLS